MRWDGFDAQETSCELNTIKRQGAAWLASFSCSGAGLTWLEDDEIQVGKDGWTLEAKIKNVHRVGAALSLLFFQAFHPLHASSLSASVALFLWSG
jgi:hypothetical protein